MKSRRKLIVIVGPTASGKSDLAIRLARKYNGEVISSDSRQVYRGMDIGTGKVTKREQRIVRHWMLDVASPTCQYSVARWRRGAERAIADITRRKKVPIICGGTGFWIDTLVYGLYLPEVKPDKKIRSRLQKLTAAQLFTRLKKLDPARAATIDRHNPVRLIRALEIVMTTHKPVPALHRSSHFNLLYLGILCPMDELEGRIKKRLDARLRAGMVAEVRRLHAQGVSWKRLENFGLEYRWVTRYLQKKVSYADMKKGLRAAIVQYAKRQMTWFKRNHSINWIKTEAEAQKLVRRFLSA